MVPIGSLDWVNQCEEVLGSIFCQTNELEVKNPFKPSFWAKFLIFLYNYAPMDSHKPQNDDLPNQLAQLVPFGSNLMSNKSSVGILVEPIIQSRLKRAKISYFYNEIQLSLTLIP